MTLVVENTTMIYTGRVKWFNNRAGYGFLTDVSSKTDGDDVFVHHSAINTKSEQYNYLVQGEYVWFNKDSTENTNHKYQATQVRGVCEGRLMCETRTLNNTAGERHVVHAPN